MEPLAPAIQANCATEFASAWSWRVRRRCWFGISGQTYATYSSRGAGHTIRCCCCALGLSPRAWQAKFSGAYKLYSPGGTLLPHALRQKRLIRGMEVIAERPDGTRVPFIPYPTPLFDASGDVTGAINVLVDVFHCKDA